MTHPEHVTTPAQAEKPAKKTRQTREKTPEAELHKLLQVGHKIKEKMGTERSSRVNDTNAVRGKLATIFQDFEHRIRTSKLSEDKGNRELFARTVGVRYGKETEDKTV